ncbi:uncharacterized protein LOC116309035 [Actinia tenebrosa]|nr:uncharacterized protein LOC116309035 [Actinia tenebrosa]
MCTLLNNKALLDLLQVIRQQLLTNISKCLTAYLFGVSLLLGSSALASLTHNSSKQDTIFHGTPVQPSFNCLTTEASCVFSREGIEVASPGLDLVFRPITQRRKRVPGSFLQRQGFQNMASSREQKMDAREVNQSPSENHTFPRSIDISVLFKTLGNFTSQNLNLKTRLVTHGRYSNGTDRELSVQSWSSLCVHKMNVGLFGPQIVKKRCFEKFPKSSVSSTEWNCYYRQQLCVS